MRIQTKIRMLSALLALLLALVSCGTPAQREENVQSQTGMLTAVIPLAAAAKDPEGREADAAVTDAVTVFSEKFWKEAVKEASGNVILSPLSLYYALSLTSNGASGETKKAFEETLGLPVEELNEYLYTLTGKLAATENSTVDIANSVWGNSGSFTISPDFIKVGEAYYAAEARSVPFNAETVKAINAWVSEKTDGMIPMLMEDLDPSLILVLLNTVLFDGVWEVEYEEDAVVPGSFTARDGKTVDADFLRSTEYGYFETKGGVGFSKAYKDGYRFVAVLPDDPDADMIAFAEEMDLGDILTGARESSKKVYAYIPKFEYSTTLGLNDVTERLGLGRIFTPLAELGGLSAAGVNDIVVSDILQKAKVILNEHGTKAAAVTEITFKNTALLPEQTPTVRLDRPFFYVIIDADGIPLFMGALENPAQ
ncbi:MAG: serpin family protein [Clostridia bacterium]|nr:serpin family protein [Clostridia bacterium]